MTSQPQPIAPAVSGGYTFARMPLLAETERLFAYVATHNFEALSQLCDDDFGIVDINPEGKNVIVPDRAGWEDWFQTLFTQLQTMQAATRTEILDYKVRTSPEMAYSVVNFCQYLAVKEQPPLKFFCIATIIWKQTPTGWKESRWHCSLTKGPVPA